MKNTTYYHPKKYPDSAVRLAYQDGWAEEKLGVKAPARDITGAGRQELARRAYEAGRSEARGEVASDLPFTDDTSLN